MSNRLAGKTAFITGAGQGIGRNGDSLASDETAFMTGAETIIDGGWSL